MKKIILIGIAAALFFTDSLFFAGAANAQSCIQPPPGIVSWWPGDGNTDDIRGPNNGVAKGTATYAAGKVGQAFSFDGAGHIEIADSPSLNLTNEITVDFWYKPASQGGYRGLIGKRASRTNYAVQFNSGGPGLGLYYNDSTVIDPNSDDGNVFEVIRFNPLPAAGQFHHFAGTYEQVSSTHVELRMYLNGALVRTETLLGNLANALTSVPLVIGRTAPNGGERYIGLIDEVELFNRALSASEIQAIFNAGSAGKCKTNTVPVDIDIKPGSDPNSINIGSGGTTAVAILGSANFDVTTINPDTLTLGTAGVKTVGKTARTLCSVADVSGDFSAGPEGTPDGFDDLVCHFITMDIAPEAGDTTATISGELNDGTAIEGTDSVNIVP